MRFKHRAATDFKLNYRLNIVGYLGYRWVSDYNINRILIWGFYIPKVNLNFVEPLLSESLPKFW